MATDYAPADFLQTVSGNIPLNITEGLKKLTMMAEPINGPNNFNLEHAAYGYISQNERLIVPAAFKSRIHTTIEEGTDFSILEVLSIAFYNYYRLKQTNLTDETALFIAIYRARLIKLGYLLREKGDRKVSIDEVDYVNNARNHHEVAYLSTAAYKAAFDSATNEEEAVLAYVEHAPDSSYKKFLAFVYGKADIFQYVVLTATQIAASTYLVFRQHGHHWKMDLDQKYNTLWRATTLEKPNFVPGNNELHRIATHSFGVYALHEKFFKYKNSNKLAETYMDRADVAPCGVAVIATCNAGIQLFRSLPLWNGLYQAYKQSIDKLEEEAAKLKDAEAAIAYHKNAGLFGKTRLQLDVSAARVLAPIVKGMIDAMGDRADISKQKTLDKHAQQNPIMAELIQGVILQAMNKIQSSAEISRAIEAAPAPAVTVSDVS